MRSELTEFGGTRRVNDVISDHQWINGAKDVVGRVKFIICLQLSELLPCTVCLAIKQPRLHDAGRWKTKTNPNINIVVGGKSSALRLTQVWKTMPQLRSEKTYDLSPANAKTNSSSKCPKLKLKTNRDVSSVQL